MAAFYLFNIVYLQITIQLSSIFLLVGICIAANAEVMPLDGAGGVESQQWRWLERMADDALEAGLPALAEGFYRDILAENALVVEDAQSMELKLTSALISQGSFDEANKCLQNIKPPYSASYYLRKSLLSYHVEAIDKMKVELSMVDAVVLTAVELPWYYILKGLAEEHDGARDQANQYYEKALASSLTATQQAQIDMLIKRGQIAAGDFDEDLLADLSKKYLQTVGTKIGYGYAREYAVVLFRMNSVDKALQVLESQLQYVGTEEKVEFDQIQLLIALIAGVDTAKGRGALRGILFNRGSTEIGLLALNLLSTSFENDDNTKGFAETLNLLIGNDEQTADHPLIERLLNLRARLKLASGDLEGAANDASRLIENYPGSELRKNTIWLQAYIAWSDEPPRYRVAAELLNQLKTELGSQTFGLLLNVLTADCYFLNGDFETASSLYLNALREYDTSAENYSLLFRLVESEIRLERYSNAAQYLDNEEFLARTKMADRWKSEWNLMDALRRSGNEAIAFERLDELLDESADTIPVFLLVRMMWMNAFLSLQVGTQKQIADVPALADEIMLIAKKWENEAESNALILSYTQLVKGQALLKMDEIEAGLQTLADLRQQHAGSQPAILSYLEEARYYAGQDRTADAQSLSVTLADQYPDSRYAPVALYEAALYARRQGLERNKNEATDLLEKLCTLYPQHPLFYYARLMQGDILRGLNNFGDAQNVYEYLINNYPEHPEGYLAELYRARCLLAQSSRNAFFLNEAAAALERLLDLPNAPVELKVEAGYTLGTAYLKQDKTMQAKEVLWRMIHQYLRQSDIVLRAKGRFWMAKVIFDLGDLLEADDALEDARKVYSLITEYSLPGSNLARSRLE